MNDLPIKTISKIKEDQLTRVCDELARDGYVVTQRKLEDFLNEETQEVERRWTIKAKLNRPPDRLGREFLD